MPTEYHSLVVPAVMFMSLTGCSDRSSLLPPTAFASPESVFQQFQRSVENNQWRQASACLSRDAQLQLATQLYSFLLAQKPDDADVAKALAELGQQHGFTVGGKLAKSASPDIGGGPDLAAPNLNQVSDLPGLVTDFAHFIERHSDSESWKALRNLSILEPSLGLVRIEGEFAVAETLVPGVDLSPPILFERTDDKWQIVDFEGRDEQRCPEAVFYHYCAAIRGRQWKRLISLLDPESQSLMLDRANQLADSAVNNDPEARQQLERLKLRSEEPVKAAAHFASLMTFAEDRLRPQHSLLAFPLNARLGEVTLVSQDEAVVPVLTQESPEPVLRLAFRKLDSRWFLHIQRSNRAKQN